MPDGTPFEFWEDRTTYQKELHVAAEHPAASDTNPGTADRPLKTIGRAAALLHPGQKAVIHAGVYRECVRPARGGNGPEAMIAYESAPGETVSLRGSEPWTGEQAAFRPTNSIVHAGRLPDGVTVWMGTLPDALFTGYHPFLLNNTSATMTLYGHVWTPEEMRRFLLKRGALFADDVPVRQVATETEIAEGDGRFWVDVEARTLHFRLPGDADPRAAALEITVREQAFAPAASGLGYIRVSGLTLEHCANATEVVSHQHGALSTAAGHHWIVEDCTLRHCNAVALDIGATQIRRLPAPALNGWHIVRRNRFSDCGVGGVCGIGKPNDVLIEDNTFERIGGVVSEKTFENAALKLHVCQRILIRRNSFRDLTQACGIWLDYQCGHNRISGNTFERIDSIFGGIHLESSFEPQRVDGNVFWGITSWRAADFPPESPMRGGHGVFADSSDCVTVDHNFFCRTASYAIAFHFKQADRIVGGRVGLNRRHAAIGNVFLQCKGRILFGRADEIVSDGNVFDAAGDAASLCIYRPEPAAVLNLAAWQTYFGLDTHSASGRVEVQRDDATSRLTWSLNGGTPPPLPVAHPTVSPGDYASPGPA